MECELWFSPSIKWGKLTLPSWARSETEKRECVFSLRLKYFDHEKPFHEAPPLSECLAQYAMLFE